MEYWRRLTEFIREFNEHACMSFPEEDEEFFDAYELKMAKAFLRDSSGTAVRVAKIILALKDISDIKIKIE